jgi:hypothetical protein
LKAKLFDTIDTIVHERPYNVATPYISNAAYASQYVKEMHAWIGRAEGLLESLPGYASETNKLEAFWRALVCNRESSGIAAPDNMRFSYYPFIDIFRWGRCLYEHILITAENGRGYDVWTTAIFMVIIFHLMEAYANGRRFEAAFVRYALGRKFFRSKEGYLGWIPAEAQEGDFLCLFENCFLPYVIRADGDGYRIVGDAYVQGVMDEHPDQVSKISFQSIKLV